MSEKFKEHQFKLRGLHYCRRYMNLVRYDAELCGACPFNGVQKARVQASSHSAYQEED